MATPSRPAVSLSCNYLWDVLALKIHYLWSMALYESFNIYFTLTYSNRELIHKFLQKTLYEGMSTSKLQAYIRRCKERNFFKYFLYYESTFKYTIFLQIHQADSDTCRVVIKVVDASI